ncbi:hypothetical protein JYU34_000416 [Plutella xylostella]|uniref:Uncharacterized protein n=1 Tax=Plutella xylostella TaxID=51655 RepID=A0ABQ7R7P2_PLUXY|nr:hypothetical protein JYU34_000416 [Plutella xylostella]
MRLNRKSVQVTVVVPQSPSVDRRACRCNKTSLAPRARPGGSGLRARGVQTYIHIAQPPPAQLLTATPAAAAAVMLKSLEGGQLLQTGSLLILESVFKTGYWQFLVLA